MTDLRTIREEITPSVNFALGRHVFRCLVTIDHMTNEIVAMVQDCPAERYVITSAREIEDGDWRCHVRPRACEFKRHLDRLFP